MTVTGLCIDAAIVLLVAFACLIAADATRGRRPTVETWANGLATVTTKEN